MPCSGLGMGAVRTLSGSLDRARRRQRPTPGDVGGYRLVATRTVPPNAHADI